MKAASLLCLMVGMVGLLPAQDLVPLPPVPPPGPLIQKRAPDFSSWTVTLKLTSPSISQALTSSQSQPDDPKSIITKTKVTKTGDVVRVELTDNQNRTWNTWLRGGQEVVAWPDGKSVGIPAKPPAGSAITNPIYVDFSNSDFEGFDWLSPANYIGIKQVCGRSCLVFKAEVLFVGIPRAVTAATDLQTRLPVQLEGPNGVTSYEFQSTPAVMQTLPSNVQKLITDQIKKEKSLARIPIAPF